MATKKFKSPGVNATELDQSFLAQAVAGIGAVLIGRTSQGPAFVPTLVGGFDEFAALFGKTDPALQMPYAAKNYLKNSGALTVVRVLGHADGTSTTNGYSYGCTVGIADFSASTGKVLAVVHASGIASGVTVAGVANDANNFIFRVGSLFAATASFLTSSANYITKVLNTDPTKYSTYGHYLYKTYPFQTPVASASWTAVSGAGGTAPNGSNSFIRDFTGAATPWVKSQQIGGLEFNLFKFKTQGHGDAANDSVKITISNVRPSAAPSATPYGTFDVTVRDFSDSDSRPLVLENFPNCDLDPLSQNYIARRIGDMYDEFDTAQRKFITYGVYPAKSKYIRVEMNTTDDFPPESLPWGFRGYDKLPFGSGSAEPSLPYTVSQKDRNGNFDANICWGVSFVSGGIYDRMRAVPDSVSSYVQTDSDFSLGYLSGAYVNGQLQYFYNTSLATQHSAIYASASLYRFSMPFQGGFDGFDIRTADPLYLANTADETNIGVVSAKRAVDTVANPDVFDMNLIAVPGVHNLKVTDYVRAMVNERKDVFFVMDVTGSSVDEAIAGVRAREIDDNYSACYYPDVKVDDKDSKRVVRLAPSVAVMGALAYNDRVGQPWFAPAGLERGGLGQFGVVSGVDKLDFNDRDDLYTNRINPITQFPNTGMVIWGQKTLQIKASALDRVNVRRLLIFAKKVVSQAAQQLVFEPNNPATWQRFTNAVNPVLEDVRKNSGVERFRVVMDTTTNTADVVDRNVMAGKIFLQPTKTAEFIDLSFVITNAGVEFGD